MKFKEAKELYYKLEPLENKCEMIEGLIINRFYILPTREYLRKNEIKVDMYDVFESEVFFAPMLKDNQEAEIVGIHQASAFTFVTSYDIDHFKSLIKELEK